MHLFLEIQLEIVYNCQKVVTHPGYLKYGCISLFKNHYSLSYQVFFKIPVLFWKSTSGKNADNTLGHM